MAEEMKSAHDILLNSLKEVQFKYNGIKSDVLPFNHIYSIRSFRYDPIKGGIESILLEDLSTHTGIHVPTDFLCNLYEVKQSKK